MNQPPSWAAGLVLASAIALLAWRARALSAAGAAAAVAVGTAAMTGGWDWGVLLVLYFASSSVLSRFRASEKEARTGARIEKSGARDAWQVLANGGLFALSAIAYSADPGLVWRLTGAGALSASAADTWATELGVLSPHRPRSILTLQPVETGVSGGVTLHGFAAAFGAAAFIAILVLTFEWPTSAAIAALAGGIAGCTLDSVLGASVQERRQCPACAAATEQRVHRCGTATVRVGGIPALDNDGVNLLATAGGAAVGAAIAVSIT